MVNFYNSCASILQPLTDLLRGETKTLNWTAAAEVAFQNAKRLLVAAVPLGYGMLDISHRQSTAYHPEANGAVKRLHRRFKDALHACATATTWAEEIPWSSSASICVSEKTLVSLPIKQFIAPLGFA
jgi:hypothetical protein